MRLGKAAHPKLVWALHSMTASADRRPLYSPCYVYDLTPKKNRTCALSREWRENLSAKLSLSRAQGFKQIPPW